MEGKPLIQALEERKISRRGFLKFCAVMAGTLALPASYIDTIAAALEKAGKPVLVWLEYQDCAGCTESFLRARGPTVAEIVLDILAVEYHETIMAAAGKQSEEALKAAIAEGGHLVVVEGSIPTAEDGIYCTIGGRAAADILQEVAANAAAVLAVGNCAAFGGLPAAAPNPTGAKAVRDIISGVPVVNLPGCPLNVDNLVATVVHYLTFKELPAVDDLGRPLFAYGKRIHDHCERRAHFDAGEFVEAWGDEGHRQGWCLYQMGCKGPITYHNCPDQRWNEATSWPVFSGHGCLGCSEPNFWDTHTPFYHTAPVFALTPPATFPPVEEEKLPQIATPVATAALGAAIGIGVGVAGAAAVAKARGGEKEDREDKEE